ncbi:MAG: hypothetical protein COZ09_10170 [Comamonadaceae bacterium CG_4_10_14_3_um_filter_60_42]|nr:MAG: hypothetical protein COZ09_10170 [Comamonadaceae bacterium CG_4_10_14_3_um_filter_60_42]
MTVVIETGFADTGFDLDAPRIGWHSEPGTVAATNEADGFPAANADAPQTYTAWRPSSVPASWRRTFTAPASPSYIAIAAHTIGSSGATVTVRKLTSSVWSNWGGDTTLTPTNDDPILFLLNPQTVDGIGIQVSTQIATIGHIRAGTVMKWPRRAVWTGQPITEGRQYNYNVNLSDSGNWLGRTQVADGLSFSMIVNNLSETFRTGDFKDFADHANTGDATFWIAPRPQGYPNELAYAWSPETVRMNRDVPNSRIAGSVTLQCRGYRAP